MEKPVVDGFDSATTYEPILSPLLLFFPQGKRSKEDVALAWDV